MLISARFHSKKPPSDLICELTVEFQIHPRVTDALEELSAAPIILIG